MTVRSQRSRSALTNTTWLRNSAAVLGWGDCCRIAPCSRGESKVIVYNLGAHQDRHRVSDIYCNIVLRRRRACFEQWNIRGMYSPTLKIKEYCYSFVSPCVLVRSWQICRDVRAEVRGRGRRSVKNYFWSQIHSNITDISKRHFHWNQTIQCYVTCCIRVGRFMFAYRLVTPATLTQLAGGKI